MLAINSLRAAARACRQVPACAAKQTRAFSYSNFESDSHEDEQSDRPLFKMELMEMVAIETGLPPRQVQKVVQTTLDKIMATVAEEKRSEKATVIE